MSKHMNRMSVCQVVPWGICRKRLRRDAWGDGGPEAHEALLSRSEHEVIPVPDNAPHEPRITALSVRFWKCTTTARVPRIPQMGESRAVLQISLSPHVTWSEGTNREHRLHQTGNIVYRWVRLKGIQEEVDAVENRTRGRQDADGADVDDRELQQD